MKSDNGIKILRKQINELKSFIEIAGLSIEKRRLYLNDPSRNFTRKRKLDFPKTVSLILGLLKKV